MIAPAHRLISPIGAICLSIAVLVFVQCQCPDPFADMLIDREPILLTEQAAMLTEMAAYDLTKEALQDEVERTNATLTAIAVAPAPPTDTASAAAQNELPPALASQEIPLIPGSSAPVITRVDFLKAMPADGNTYYGWVSFTDADGDVNRIKIESVRSTSPTTGSEYEPHLQGSPTAGRARIGFYCTVKSQHTMRATLFDAAGNSSNSMEYSFECY